MCHLIQTLMLQYIEAVYKVFPLHNIFDLLVDEFSFLIFTIEIAIRFLIHELIMYANMYLIYSANDNQRNTYTEEILSNF